MESVLENEMGSESGGAAVPRDLPERGFGD
jgi:hypothetical protein